MTDLRRVRGTQPEQPNHIEINKDTVYERTNIVRVDDDPQEGVEGDGFHGWEYDEVTYGVEEYANIVMGRAFDGDIEAALVALSEFNAANNA